MWGIIAGSGFEHFSEFQTLEELSLSTPFGEASCGTKRALLSDTEIIFLPRHGRHHDLLPSEINYRANIYLLKKLGVTQILSFASVGSLREELQPGEVVIPHQYLDRTKGLRSHTFSDKGLVAHISLAEPVSKTLTTYLQTSYQPAHFQMHFQKTYVCIEGPAFSTKAESNYYRLIGADVVGMTGFPEYALCAEAGIAYLPCCFVTDYDCWKENEAPVSIEGITKILKANKQKAFAIAKHLIPSPVSSSLTKEKSLSNAVLSNMALLKPDQKALLELFSN